MKALVQVVASGDIVASTLARFALCAGVGLGLIVVAACISAKASEETGASAAPAADAPPANVYTTGVAPAAPAPGDRGAYRAIIVREAAAAGVPAEVAEAVLAVESAYNPNVIGGDGEIGLMQLLPSTARMLGFVGSLADLAVPETNIHYGVTYLAGAWRRAAGDLCTAAMKYRAGHGEGRFSHRSVDYCVRVRAYLAARGYPVFGAVPEATFGERTASRGRNSVRLAGRIDFNALNARLHAMTIQAAIPAARTLR